MSTSANDLFGLNGKIALVTGASSGLGWHFSKVLAAAGAHVVVAARRKERLQALCDEIAADGGKASAVTLDVTDAQSVTACFNACEKVAGVPDIVVSNAGTTITKMAVDQTPEDFDQVINATKAGQYYQYCFHSW